MHFINNTFCEFGTEGIKMRRQVSAIKELSFCVAFALILPLPALETKLRDSCVLYLSYIPGFTSLVFWKKEKQ